MVNRWHTFVAGLFLMLCSGPVFSFGAIAGSLRAILGATEREVQAIGTSGNVGLWVKVIGGLVFDRAGASATLLGGAVMAGLGYLLMLVVLTQRWPALVAAAAWFLAGQGSSWIYMCSMFANMGNFVAEERSCAVGALACFFGLSAPVFIAVLDGCTGGHFGPDGKCAGGVLGGSVIAYMGLLTVVVPSVVLLAACVTSDSHADEDKAGGRRFGALLVFALLLICFITSTNYYAVSVDASVKTWAGFVLPVLLLLPCLLPLSLQGPAGHSKDAAEEEDEDSQQESEGEEEEEDDDEEEAEEEAEMPIQPLGPAKVVRTRRFWALTLAFGATVGADIMTLNVMSSVVHALGKEGLVAHVCVIVITGCDACSRFLTGVAAARALPPATLLVLSPVLLVLGQLLLGTSTSNSALYAACAMLGASDGIMWSLGPLLTGRLFGLSSAGGNFGCVVLGAAVLEFIFALVLEPAVYDRHLQPGQTVCIGRGCFQLTHWILALAGCIAAVAALLLRRWQVEDASEAEALDAALLRA